VPVQSVLIPVALAITTLKKHEQKSLSPFSGRDFLFSCYTNTLTTIVPNSIFFITA